MAKLSEQPELERLDYKPSNYVGSDADGANPNTNLLIIMEIESLLNQANEKMYKLPIHTIRSKAIEEIDVLNRVTVQTELKEAFE